MNARSLVARLAAMGAVITAAWWALLPLEQPDLSPPPPLGDSEDAPVDPAAFAILDDAAFHTPLWVAPPAPPPPVAETAPAQPPPLKLQLLAIVRQETLADRDHAPTGGYKALLYDPDADKIIEVASGDSIGSCTVVGIADRELTLKDSAGTRTLSLRTNRVGGGA